MSNYQEYTVRVYPYKTEWLNSKGELHRVDGPAIEGANGSKEWYLNGKLHRVDGPAIENANGYKAWYLNGKSHRVDGPACEYANGDKTWYLNGQIHRVDGPAAEDANGSKFWYLHGTLVSEAEHARQTASPLQTSCEGKVIEIDGKKYVLTAV